MCNPGLSVLGHWLTSLGQVVFEITDQQVRNRSLLGNQFSGK